MTTAEGGVFLTKHKDVAEAVTRQKAFGVDRHMGERKVPGVYDVTRLGYNYRMNEIQAAIGIEQLKRMPGFLEKRKANYEALAAGLAEIGEISLFQSSHGDYQSSYYCLSAVLDPKLAELRFEIVEALKAAGVGTSVYYPRPVPHMTYYREKYGFAAGSFPNASRISYGSIALPVGPHLGVEDMEFITRSMKDAIKKVK